MQISKQRLNNCMREVKLYHNKGLAVTAMIAHIEDNGVSIIFDHSHEGQEPITIQESVRVVILTDIMSQYLDKQLNLRTATLQAHERIIERITQIQGGEQQC